METRSAKRKKIVLMNNGPSNEEHQQYHHHHHEDRITSLPDDIIHQIFSYLPIKSVARTSVLSKRWNNLWFSFPDLDFTTVNTLSINPPRRRRRRTGKRPHPKYPKHSDYIDQISTLLEKHSDIRVLRLHAFLSFSRLTGLIRNAVRRNVQELDVEVATCDYFNFPRSIINSGTIKTLRLKSLHPGFRLPPLEIMRDGFRSLSVLLLSRPVLHDCPSLVDLFTDSSFPLLKILHLENCFGMKRLRVECPALEDLSLESCFQLWDLEVRVGKLERLRVSSCFDTHEFGSRVRIEAPRLQVVVWSYNAVTDECGLMKLDCLHEAFVGFFRLNQEGLSEAKVVSVWNLLSGISSCHSLTLESQCVEIISKSNQFAGISLCPFNKLKSLELSTGFEKHNNPGLASLFRSSPNIHTIVIKIITNQNIERRQWNKELWQSSSSGEERYWESQTQYLKSFLHHLKVVKIHGFTECANDISLVKFFLKQGKVLQELFLCTSSLSKPRDSLLREKIKSQIMGFSWASSNANIVFQ